jgi:AcrR family transcriptional regulator
MFSAEVRALTLLCRCSLSKRNMEQRQKHHHKKDYGRCKKTDRRSGIYVTVRNMAKEVGITEAAIYRHFKSKTEILSFLAESVADGLLHDIDMARNIGFTSLDIIDEILRSHLSRIEQKRGMSFLVLAEIISFGDKFLNRKVSDHIQIYVGRLRLLLADGARAGLIRRDLDLAAAALLLFGMIQGLVNIWALNGYKFDLVEKYSELWKVYKRSLTPC